MASPYLLIGVFPELLRFLPKPGAWMETFKQIMGFVLLATVVFILSFMEPAAVVPTVALLLGVGVACWLVSRTPLTAELGDRLQSWALAGAVVLLSAVGCRFGWLLCRSDEPRRPGSRSRSSGCSRSPSTRAAPCSSISRPTGASTARCSRRPCSTPSRSNRRSPIRRRHDVRRLHRLSAGDRAHDSRAQEQRRAGDRHLPRRPPYEPIVFRDGYTARGLIAALKQATDGKATKLAKTVASAVPALN